MTAAVKTQDGPTLAELKTINVENSDHVGFLKTGSRVAMSLSLAGAAVATALFFRGSVADFSTLAGNLSGVVNGWGHFGIIIASSLLGYAGWGMRHQAADAIKQENEAVDAAHEQTKKELYDKAKANFIAEINKKSGNTVSALTHDELATVAMFSDKDIEDLDPLVAAEVYRVHREIMLKEAEDKNINVNIAINDSEIDFEKSTPALLKQLFKTQRDSLRNNNELNTRLEKMRNEYEARAESNLHKGFIGGLAVGNSRDAGAALAVVFLALAAAVVVAGPVGAAVSNLVPLPREKIYNEPAAGAVELDRAPDALVKKARFKQPDASI